MSYKSIHTAIGLQLLAQAEATGSQIQLTHIAIGDGGGYPIDVNVSMQSLVRERFRAPVNRIFQDPENENQFTAEVIIPVTVGGFVMREIGIFDSNGNLFIVGNIPETHKSTAAEGAYTDTVFRIPFMVSNAETVSLMIDPNVVQATHSWVINTLTTAFLIPGGTTGQVLKKASNLDGQFIWSDPDAANVFVRSVEEQQLLAEDQTHVDFTLVTTTGLAIYIDGLRIPNKVGTEGWIANTAASITLGQAYTPGAKILAVQNEPLGGFPYPLAQGSNLSDVPDKALARQNLNVFSKEESRLYGIQPGMIVYFGRTTAPPGYLKANGAAISRTAYPELFAEIGTTFGAGDNVSTFHLPDLRGEFIRGWDDGRGVDPDRHLGSRQSADIQPHSHTIETGFDATNHNGQLYRVAGGDGLWNNQVVNVSSKLNVGSETRPRNTALLACIKY